MEYLPSPDLTAAASAAFTARFGAAPDAIGRAPGRVNLIGEHTDYNGGLCLPIALPHAAYAAVARRDDGIIRVVSDQTGHWEGSTADLVPGATGDASYVLASLWAAREAGIAVNGLDVHIDSQVPMGSGLSSSAALICATVAAVADGQLTSRNLVEAAIRAENDGVGAPTGGLDQTVSVLARAGHAVLLDFAAGSERVVRQVPWRPESAGHSLLVVDTGVRHSHADGGYGNRRAESEAAAEVLGVTHLGQADDLTALDDPILARRARHVVTEISRVRSVVDAVGSGNWSEVGRLFTASHLSLRDDFEVSCAELDEVVDVALDRGALGARMTGGGFGGSAIVLAPRSEMDAIAGAIVAALTALGTTPALLHSPASAGASLNC
ncbi:MAG: galactokinase [Nocardioides sp.]